MSTTEDQSGQAGQTDAERIAQLEAELADARSQQDAADAQLSDAEKIAQLESQLSSTQTELAKTRDALSTAQAAPAVPAEALPAHVAPSKVQAILDAVEAGEPIVHDELVAAKVELQHYLDTAGPMKALVDAWEKLRQL